MPPIEVRNRRRQFASETSRSYEKYKDSPFYRHLIAELDRKEATGIGSFLERQTVRIIGIESHLSLSVYNGSFMVIPAVPGRPESMLFIGRGDLPNTQLGALTSANPKRPEILHPGNWAILSPKDTQRKWVQNGLYFPDTEDPTITPVPWVDNEGSEELITVTRTTPRGDQSGQVESFRAATLGLTRKITPNGHEWKVREHGTSKNDEKDFVMAIDHALGRKPRDERKKIVMMSRQRRVLEGGDIVAGYHFDWKELTSVDQLDQAMKDLSADETKQIDDGRPAGETRSWPGSNQLIILENGNIGLLEHFGMTNGILRPYLAATAELSRDGSLIRRPSAIASTYQVPGVETTGSKQRDLDEVLFPKQILEGTTKINGKEVAVSWTLVASARDNAVLAGGLRENPFSAPFDPASNRYNRADIRTLVEHGLPLSSSAYKYLK